MTDNATGIDTGPSRGNPVDADTITIECDKEITPRLVIAIEFGIYDCHYALQWRSDYENANCLESIKVPTKWFLRGFRTRKTPSCLLLKPDKSIAEFGSRAVIQFIRNESLHKRRRPKDWKDWYFFRFFKMRLYTSEELTVDTPMEAANGKHLSAVEVLAKTIEYLKDEAINNLREDGYVYPEEVTKWVITVPAIWNDSAKHVMQEAAEKAGINGRNLSIAFESECAALYCTKVPLEKMEFATGNNKRTNIAAPGQTMMIVHMRRDTVDITTIKINEDKTSQQVYKSSGCPWGCSKVNEKFEMFLVELIGAETVRTFVEKHALDYHDLQIDFESRKREMEWSDDQIPIKLPDSLRQLWERAECNEIDDILEEKACLGKIEFMTERLFLEAKIFQRFFQDTIDGLLKYINEEVFADMSNISVNSIILVGGFAESSYVMQYVKDNLRHRNIPVVRPQLPDLAVLNGAVLFGQNEKIVTPMVLRHSYGIAMTMEFVPNKHKEEEKYKLDNMIMANNVFSMLLSGNPFQ